MSEQTGEQIVHDSTTVLVKSVDAAESMMKGNADALSDSGNAARVAVQDLTKAYQEMATKNAKNLTAAMQKLAVVKSPAEFMELQQRLFKETFEAFVSDSQRIARLTTAVFAAAFEPVKKRVAAVQDSATLSQQL